MSTVATYRLALLRRVALTLAAHALDGLVLELVDVDAEAVDDLLAANLARRHERDDNVLWQDVAHAHPP